MSWRDESMADFLRRHMAWWTARLERAPDDETKDECLYEIWLLNQALDVYGRPT